MMRPVFPALALSAGYIVLCGLYIWLSGRIAADASHSVESLQQIEWLKGTIFIFVTGLVFFFFAYGMLRRIDQQSRDLMVQKNALVLADRRAMAGSFALSVAHDMNNQIMVLQAGWEELMHSTPPGRHDNLEFVQRALNDLTRLSRQLLNMGRNSVANDFRLVRIMDMYDEVMTLCQRHQRTRHCVIRAGIPVDLEAKLNPAIMSQMLFNLILNAADAADGNGQIEVRAHQHGRRVVIEVHDNGPGIPADMRTDVVKPFYTTKKSGHGLGFMSVVACAEIHDGQVEILESDLGGACIRVSLNSSESTEGKKNPPELADAVR